MELLHFKHIQHASMLALLCMYRYIIAPSVNILCISTIVLMVAFVNLILKKMMMMMMIFSESALELESKSSSYPNNTPFISACCFLHFFPCNLFPHQVLNRSLTAVTGSVDVIISLGRTDAKLYCHSGLGLQSSVEGLQ